MTKARKNGWKNKIISVSKEIYHTELDIREWLEFLDRGYENWGKDKIKVKDLIAEDIDKIEKDLLVKLRKYILKAETDGLSERELMGLEKDKNYLRETEKFLDNIDVKGGTVL